MPSRKMFLSNSLRIIRNSAGIEGLKNQTSKLRKLVDQTCKVCVYDHGCFVYVFFGSFVKDTVLTNDRWM